MKRVPDYLTLSRGFIAVAILVLGFIENSGHSAQSALPIVLLLTMLGWTTDIFDGRIARKINKPPTWVGEREFAFDMAMVFAGLCYLVLSGFIPFVPALIYVMVAAAFIAYFRSKMITMSFATPVVALPLVVAYFQAPHALVWFVVWIVAALLLDWRRFTGVVREFIYNARNLSGR
ncbi:CDP-alcohol phosphatidyltransferase family protein [Candidatus Bipolaricaulota bacterium]